MSTVSVIIPTMNRPELLERCLAALFREIGNSSDIETIVTDDGSTSDNVARNRLLCKQYTAHFVEPEGHHGMAVARNRGSCRARGEWLVFLDDDVAVDEGWHAVLIDTLDRLSPTTVGFEARVNPSGSGVWDREVSNLNGGAFLTCHMCVKRSEFERLGGFDPVFEFKGPYCEDHELAARLLQWGDVPFISAMSVTHAPRKVRLLKYLVSASRRCREMLCAEQYFFIKHPDRYHRFRVHRTFMGTLHGIQFRNVVNDLRRRRVHTLAAHPVQTAALVTGSLIEQVTAWILMPAFLASNNNASTPLSTRFDRNRTGSVWQVAPDRISHLRVRRSFIASLLFVVNRRPVYDIRPVMHRVGKAGGDHQSNIFFRVDDVFFDDPDSVEKLCEVFGERSMPFLAAITGKDLCDEARRPLVEMVRKSGGCIGIHGFCHTGTFGPYASELLQMRIPEILAKIDAIRRTGIFNGGRPLILVPPFNAIGPGQITALAQHFSIITGGPETVRFTDRYIGPTAILGGGWYFPSLHPFYGCARTILKNAPLAPIPAPVCLSTHLVDEVRDNFVALSRLLDKLPVGTRAWDGVF